MLVFIITNKDNNYDLFNVRTKIVLPEISAEPFPFLIEASIPTYGSLSEPLKINYKIYNKTQTQTLDLECTLEQNEYFALSGKKMVGFENKFFFKFFISNFM